MVQRYHPPQIRTGGWPASSTRAELAAVVMALQGTPRADDLAILIDSAAAIQKTTMVPESRLPTGRAQGQGP